MSNEATILRIRAQVENLEGLNRARSAVRNFATESKAASNDLGKLRGMFKELGAESLRSVNNLKNYRAGLDALRQSAEIGSTTFNELTLEIKQLDGELGALQGKQNAVTQGFNRITRATNAAAAAQRSYNGLIRNPLTGAYGGIAGGTQYGSPIGPVAPPDYAGRIAQQQRDASAQSARDARRAQKMQERGQYIRSNLDLIPGSRDPRTGALIGESDYITPFMNVGTQYAQPIGPQPAPKRAPSRYGGARGLAQGAGAIASGGIFGGPEGALGGALGFAMAGPQGAAIGAAGGATVGIARQALASTASYSAELQKQRIALSQVVGSQTEYNNSLKFISKTSRELAIPQDIVLKNFTRLSASVIGAGGSVKDAEKAFRGISVGILGTGGNLQSLDAALLATAQVFSKGKVSAEELRGQIGERLPGAFTLFAKSIDKTPQQLDKALQDGEVTLLDFQKFVEALTVRYNKSAEEIFKSPAAAGVRLEAELSLLKEKVGSALLPIGALFQVVFAEGVKVINDTIDSLSNLGKQFSDAIGGAKGLAQIIAGLTKTMIIFGGVTAGVFLATNITTFTNALKGALVVMRNLLTIERIMLGVSTARAAIETTIAGLKSGATPYTKLAGGALGLTAGVALVAGVGKVIDDVSNKITSGLAGLAKMPELTFTQTNTNGGLGATGGGDTANQKAKKAKKELIDLTMTEYRLIKAINKETEDGRLVQAAFFQYNLDYEQALLAFQRGQIGPLKKQAEFDEAEKKVRQTIAGIFKGYGAELMDQLDTQKSYNQVLDDLANKSRYISEEEQKRLDVARQLKEIIEEYPTILGTGAVNAEELKRKLQEALEKAAGFKLTVGEQVVKSLKDAYKSATDLGTSLSSVAVNGVNGIADAFAELALTGKVSFADLTRSILADLTKIFMRMAVFEFLNFAFPGLKLKTNAVGNVYAQNGIQKFAMGGVVNKPTIFPFANGTGLMGEAGPEAIMPLQRAANGKLGVIASGGGTTNVTVNVDAGGTSVEGDQAQAKQLGVVVSAAVQAELVKQQRPGGLLAGTRR
jgi:tape measure domain-containing protein